MHEPREIVWQSLAWASTNVLRLTRSREQNINAHSIIAGKSDRQVPFAIDYVIELTSDWDVKRLVIKSLLDSRTISLTHKGNKWYDGAEKHLVEYDDVAFIDISLSPLTNTLPIQRLNFNNMSQKIEAIYIDLPDFSLRKVQQYYSKLDDKTYRYQDIEIPDFIAEIVVDQDGLVIDYPGLFRRV